MRLPLRHRRRRRREGSGYVSPEFKLCPLGPFMNSSIVFKGFSLLASPQVIIHSSGSLSGVQSCPTIQASSITTMILDDTASLSGCKNVRPCVRGDPLLPSHLPLWNSLLSLSFRASPSPPLPPLILIPPKSTGNTWSNYFAISGTAASEQGASHIPSPHMCASSVLQKR